MKKIIYFLCIMLFGLSVKASPIIRVDYLEGIYSNRIGDKLYSGKMGYIYVDDKIAYCLDPFELVGKTYYEDSEYLNKIKKDDLLYFEMVAYYGYNNTNRNSIYYYMATQELIWEKIIGESNVYWTTSEYSNGEKINIESYKKEILNDVNNFFIKPSFDEKTLSSSMFEIKEIEDNENVLSNYIITYDGKNIISINNNKLNVKFLDYGTTQVELSRKIKTDNNTIIYTGKGNQTLAIFGVNEETKSHFSITTTKPKKKILNINFIDKNSGEKIDTDFQICDINGNKIKSSLINNNGTYTYNDKLDIGTYFLCSISKDYSNNTNMSFKITDYFNEEETINMYLEQMPKIQGNSKLELNEVEKIDINSNDKTNIIEESSNLYELPNTCNYYLRKYSILGIIFLIGIFCYEIKNIRN